MLLPKVRTVDILEQEADKELLLYDLRVDKAYTLNETSVIIYRACGRKTFDELKRKHDLTDDLIYFALDELQKNDLLAGYESRRFTGLSRREVIKRVGLSSMIALPIVVSIAVPGAANAASSSCTTGIDGSDSANGMLGRGAPCDCRISVNGSFQPCNTTRGGIPGSGSGCKRGCVCRYTGTAASCLVPSGDDCQGTCG